MVKCVFRGGIGIYVVSVRTSRLLLGGPTTSTEVVYTLTHSVVHEIVKSSKFCLQKIKYLCRGKTSNLSRLSITSSAEKNFTAFGTDSGLICPCGYGGKCNNQNELCNCINHGKDYAVDQGLLINKEIFPIVKISMQKFKDDQTNYEIVLENLECGPHQFGIPTNCDQVKTTTRDLETVSMIDPDGETGDQEGNLMPEYVKCLHGESHSVTSISVKRREMVIEKAVTGIEYMNSIEFIMKLIEKSKYCSQFVQYQCQNSVLFQDHKSGFFSPRGRVEYGPGGRGHYEACGCALTEMCLGNKLCNCQNKLSSSDFGIENNKSSLPMTSFNTISPNGGKIVIKSINCAQYQHDLLFSCLFYKMKNFPMNYTYMVKINNQTMPVHCEETQYGVLSLVKFKITKVFSKQWWRFTFTSVAGNVVELIENSAYCLQEIRLSCVRNIKNSESMDIIFSNGKRTVEKLSTLFCGDRDSCDCSGEEKIYTVPATSIPMININTGNIVLNRSDIKCFDLYDSCLSTIRHLHLKMGETPPSGYYFIDPDGEGPIKPFKVYCTSGGLTILRPGPGIITFGTKSPLTMKINYTLTYTQLQYVLQQSSSCKQHIKLKCRKFPISDHLSWISIDGKKNIDWGNADGFPTCGCGLHQKCSSNQDQKCTCDSNSDEELSDEGFIMDKSRLPIMGIRTFNLTSLSRRGLIYAIVGDLVCSRLQLDLPIDCQRELIDSNFNLKNSHSLVIDPDGKQGPGKPFSVWCQIMSDPIYSITMITKSIKGTAGTMENINYHGITDYQLASLTSASTYCRQKVSVTCPVGGILRVGENIFVRTRDNQMSQTWINSENKTCNGELCSCGGDKNSKLAGYLINKSEIPIKGFKVTENGQNVVAEVGDLECFFIQKNCNEYLEAHKSYNFLMNEYNAVDPDGVLGQDPFSVRCQYNYEYGILETIVRVRDNETVVSNGSVSIIYEKANYVQIHQLIKHVNYCWQELWFTCGKTDKITGNAAILDFNTKKMYNWAGAPVNGGKCLCSTTATCPENHQCRCDRERSHTAVEGGLVLDKAIMPISGVYFKKAAKGGLKIGNVHCAKKLIDLPQNCESVTKITNHETELLIQPIFHVQPFYVFCKIFKGTSITQISTRLVKSGKKIKIEYINVDFAQLRFLVSTFHYCVLPIKYSCSSATDLLSTLKVEMISRKKTPQLNYPVSKCSCSGSCLRNRDCNCLANIAENRSDVGIFSIRSPSDIPVSIISEDSFGSFTVGPIQCSNSQIEIDECQTGFNDCDKFAVCENLKIGFRCSCPKGFTGNGRLCSDINECSEIGVFRHNCPINSFCVNSPGSFSCECSKGYRMVDGVCKDINECTDSLVRHNCDRKAKCHNLPGKYYCQCVEGLKGSGYQGQCHKLKECKIFGDPHVHLFDGAWSHFQGKCRYILTRDRSERWEIIGDYINMRTDASNGRLEHSDYATWIQAVTVYHNGDRIDLMRNFEIYVNHQRVYLPVIYPGYFILFQRNKMVLISVLFDFTVEFDADHIVSIFVGKNKNVTGMCGNANDDSTDDFEHGPVVLCKNKSDINAFELSWTSPDASINGDSCTKDMDCNEERPCPSIGQFRKKCYKAISLESFDYCMNRMKANILEELISSCAFDLCHSNSSICPFGTVIENYCSSIGLRVGTWKGVGPYSECCSGLDYFLAFQCPVNMEWKKSDGKCIESCTQNSPVCFDGGSEGCYCRNGFIYSGSKCVKPRECGFWFFST